MKLLAKFNGCLACLFLIVFLGALGSSPVMAKVDCNDSKWDGHPACPDDSDPDPPPAPDPEPDPDDPCLTSTSPFPAFVFKRNLGGPRQSDYTFFLASEDGVCERVLYDVSPESPSVNSWEVVLNYDQVDNRGYVTWISRGSYENPLEDAIWLLEFAVEGNNIASQSDPELIIVLPDNDEAEAEAYLPELDVAKDLQRLVFTYWKFIPEDWGQVHVVNIEDCRDPNWPCSPNAENLVLDGWAAHGWGRVAWGPLGERFYLSEAVGTSGVLSRRIRMVTDVNGEWTDRVLLSSIDYPKYDGIWRFSSGALGDREMLAFRHTGDCRTISVIDVAECEAGITCGPEAQFYGTNPGWTDRGTVVHEMVERVKKHPRKEIYECIYSDMIGEWDPETMSITPLVEGEDPDTK